MAQQTMVELIDDLDGGPAEHTIVFSLGDTSFVIDLNEENARKFQADLEPYLRAARPAPRKRLPQRSAVSRRRTKEIRAWAVERGLMVASSGYGRLPTPVITAWERAQAEQKGNNA